MTTAVDVGMFRLSRKDRKALLEGVDERLRQVGREVDSAVEQLRKARLGPEDLEEELATIEPTARSSAR